ncbi:uncharacterized protein LOC127291625 isoform X1 [Leptopilina boulardi]|uniref:uncharacterized protein LOC127291625 isoform X1 n=1 Tax=Leptopilina boulardi TaxID=63433 RepID=UPI0021F53761|nr:uncharacterized protein LOC127291625 isoform X1 [Leptopilina boulardi]
MNDSLQKPSRTYKRYLQRDSNEPIPSTTWYRLRKKRKLNISLNSTMAGCSYESTIDNKHEEHNIQENRDIPEGETNFEIDEELNSSINEGIDHHIIDTIEEIDIDTDGNLPQILYDAVDNLMEDIETSEMAGTQHEENENEEDDFFFDAIGDTNDCNESDAAEEEEEEILGKKSFASLTDLMGNKIFDRPIQTVVNKSVAEVIIMIVKYCLIYSLSLSGMTDLFKLINCIFAEPILPNTRYYIDKLFYPKDRVTLHATCNECGAYIGKFKKHYRTLKCKVCKLKINVKSYVYKDFFVTMDVSMPIAKLIETNYEYYKYVINERNNEKDVVKDIYDGKEYRNFVNSLSETDKRGYATVTFNTDGAPLFKSSTYSIWPVYLMVKELPFSVRSKELILAALWFGKDKPNMNVFLDPFVNSMNKLSVLGVPCNLNNSISRIKIFPLVCSVDCVARAPVQGFNQFNGKYGCGLCLHPGVWVKNKKNSRYGNIKYALMDNVPEPRNAKSTLSHMKEAVEKGKPKFGVKNSSSLINLLKFDIIKGCVPEPMHCISGVAKQFATLWFGTKQKAGLFKKCIINDIDTFMRNIKVTNQICRLTRLLSEKEFWKAKEWENWVLYFSLPILTTVLPSENKKYAEHWSLFVEALHLLLKDDIKIWEIDLADKLLHEFVAGIEKIYSAASMTFNVHLLLHLAKTVYYWGPLWAFSAFAFESGNGKLLKVIHASKGVHHQICRRISLQYCHLSLKDRIYPIASQRIITYCTSYLVQKSLKLFEVRYFGPSSTVDDNWINLLQLISQKASSYKKIIKNGCLYQSSLKNNHRSNNSFAQLLNGQYFKINKFIIDTGSKKEYTIGQKIIVEDAFIETCKVIKKITKIETWETAILTKNINKVCVQIKLNDNEYLCVVPNLHFY